MNSETPGLTPALFAKLKSEIESAGEARFRIAGTSMLPLIRPGEIIRVEPLQGEPEKFDILVFKADDRLMGHYVWHLNELSAVAGEKTVVTRGLYHGLEDLPVPMESVLGRVTNFRIGFFRRLLLNLSAAFRRRR